MYDRLTYEELTKFLKELSDSEKVNKRNFVMRTDKLGVIIYKDKARGLLGQNPLTQKEKDNIKPGLYLINERGVQGIDW